MTPEEQEIFQQLKSRMDHLEMELRTAQGQQLYDITVRNPRVEHRISTLETRTRYVRQPLPHVTDYMYRIRNQPQGYNYMGYYTGK